MQSDIVHGLIQVALSTCKEEGKATVAGSESASNLNEEKGCARDVVQSLYNLASFDRPRFYIPGETVRQSRDRLRFLLWGGLYALYYLLPHAKVKEVAEFCEASRIKDMELRDFEDMIKSVRLHVQSLESSSSAAVVHKLLPPAPAAEAQPAASTASPEEENRDGEDHFPGAGTAKAIDACGPQDVCFPE
ncbi:MAG: hypothetical protein P4L67_00285 [Candidatus Pacebacteria bacterium]|nr:hypothetical protein [Candidatus Paceibacterota bacterium]